MRVGPLLLLAPLLFAEETGTIKGRVLRADNRPWKNAQVVAFGIDGQEITRHVTSADGDGGFRFQALRSGRYVLVVSVQNGGPSLEQALASELAKLLARANADGHPHLVELAAGAVVWHEIRVPRSVSVRGTVTSAGTPVTGATVEFVPLDKEDRASWAVTPSRLRYPETDARGVFDVGTLPVGKYALVIRVGEREVLAGTREIAGSNVRLGVVLGSYRIRLRIEDARGRPIRSAQFGATRRDPRVPWGGTVRTRSLKASSSRGGVFELPYATAGRWEVYANVDSAHVVESVDVGPAAPCPLVVLRLPSTGTLIVRTTDVQGHPVDGQQILVCHPSGRPSYSFRTGETGEWRRRLRAEVWNVGLASNIGLAFDGKPRAINVGPGRETIVELVVR